MLPAFLPPSWIVVHSYLMILVCMEMPTYCKDYCVTSIQHPYSVRYIPIVLREKNDHVQIVQSYLSYL